MTQKQNTVHNTVQNTVLWEASGEYLEASLLWGFKKHLEAKYSTQFKSYSELQKWSVDEFQSFWRELLGWSGIQYSGSSDLVYKNDSSKFYTGVWFPGLSLSYSENLLSRLSEVPLRAFYEKNELIAELTKDELLGAVLYFQVFFKQEGLQEGDHVAAFVGNNHLALVAMLAVNSLGGVWASCSPDFGEQGVLDRFIQVEPKFFLYDTQSVYGGKRFDLSEKVKNIQTALSEKLSSKIKMQSFSLRDLWEKAKGQKAKLTDLSFKRVSFSAPLYILFSSGTTGVPKCIVHATGGVLLQHVKELLLHSNIQKGERFSYYTTTGWMMWNWMLSGLFAGAELYTLEGSPMVGDWSLWDFVNENKITAFGTSARFIAACRSKGMTPKIKLPRITFSTGSPLLPEDFDYYYSVIDPEKKSQLASISGGTDIVSCFMLGNPWSPVRRGEIQAAGLGMNIDSLDAHGKSLRGEDGELVCKTPFPSMPVGFLNDPENRRYEDAYFSRFPGIWHHGDFITLTQEGGVQIHGRSDATLNPGGVRIGTAEIYRVVELEPEVADSLVVGKVIDGDEKVVLFLKLKQGTLSDDLKLRIKKDLKTKASPRHVPDFIFEVAEIPYTLSGKKVEIAVKRLLKGEASQNLEALQNPLVLKSFEKFKALIEARNESK
ncbi:MAG: acetoacetate--CoA ligase [Bdellovibrionota bacterium]